MTTTSVPKIRRASGRFEDEPAEAWPRQLRVALVGSSGGSTHRGNAHTEVSALAAQLRGLDDGEACILSHCVYVCADVPLNRPSSDTPATLFTLSGQLDGAADCENGTHVRKEVQPRRGCAASCASGSTRVPRARAGGRHRVPTTANGGGQTHREVSREASPPKLEERLKANLEAVNELAEECDEQLAEAVYNGLVDAMVLVSADARPSAGINSASLAAAVSMGIPVVGTGGSSLGEATRAGACLLETGGSVGTTAISRAMSAACAFGAHWGFSYSPQLPPAQLDLQPILDCALPCFLALLVLLSGAAALTQHAPVLKLPGAPALHAAASRVNAMALAVGGGRATAQLEPNGSSGSLAGVIAGGVSLCGGASAVAALVVGLLAGLGCRRALAHSLHLGLPATAATLYTVGASGALAGLLGALLAPHTSVLSEALRAALAAPAHHSVGAGAVAGVVVGVLTKVGSVRGHYHSLILPLILLEMESGKPALLGALDAACLCCVCAGVCAAVCLTARSPAEGIACRRAVRINLLFGDFVEACYPYMARDAWVQLAALLGAAVAGALVGASAARSSAYLPVPLALALADARSAFAAACASAFCLPFVVTLLRRWPPPGAARSITRAPSSRK